MVGKIESGDFITRHSIKPKGEDKELKDYPGISESGESLARERAKDILESLEKEPEGTILWLGLGTDLIRTKSTIRVYGDEIKKILQEQERRDILAYSEEDLLNLGSGYNKRIKALQEIVKKNSKAKIVINAPFFLKEMATMGENNWFTKEGKPTDFTKILMERNNNDKLKAEKDWFDNKGKIGEYIVSSAEQVAENHIKALNRLREFAQKFLEGRRIVVGGVGHDIFLDALAVYLLNNGKVSSEAFEKLLSESIRETQMVKVIADQKGSTLVFGEHKIPINEK